MWNEGDTGHDQEDSVQSHHVTLLLRPAEIHGLCWVLCVGVFTLLILSFEDLLNALAYGGVLFAGQVHHLELRTVRHHLD